MNRLRLPVCLLAFTLAIPALAQNNQTKPSRAALNLLQEAFTSIAEEVEPAVVTITARKTIRPTAAAKPDEDPLASPFGRPRTRAFRSQGTGSGVLISNDGWILTNDHVVGGADKVTVKLHDGREFDGEVKRDRRSDLALVKITGSNLQSARLGDSDKVKVGMWAIAIGSPYRYDGSMSVGIISSLFRKQEIRSFDGAGRFYPDMIQTDAAINPGNSGGPLVNIDGEVVGINTAIESDGGGSIGIGFAIPINAAKFVIDQLRSRGKVTYGYLGIEPDTVTPRLAASYKVSNGAIVRGEPAPDSPAAKAGIQADDVITEIDGKPIKSELDLRTTVSHIKPGSSVNVVFVRGGVEKRVKAVIDEWKDDAPPTEKAEAPAAKPGLGIEVAALSPENLKSAGIDDKVEGVFLKTIDPGSSATETELRQGAIILRVNDVPTPTVEAFNKQTASVKSGDVLRLLWTKRIGGGLVKRVAIVTVD